MNRNYRDIEALNNVLHAPVKLAHIAGLRESAFGENAHDVALLQFRASKLDGLDHPALCTGRNPDGVNQRKRPREPVVPLLIYHEADKSLDARADQESIDVRNVI